MNAAPVLSVVVPFYNEEDNVAQVLAEVRQHLPEAEIIAVDDGSTDATWQCILAMEGVRGFRFSQNRGQSAAIYHGLHQAQGEFCATMDGDGQNDPADFPALLQAAREGPPRTIAVGRRRKRQDAWHRIVASRVANHIRKLLLNDGVSDTGCSMKVFPRAAVSLLVPFNGLHRFLPPIFRHGGYTLVEVEVNHRPRSNGLSKYSNWERALRGIYDLIGMGWLLSRKIVFPPTEEK